MNARTLVLSDDPLDLQQQLVFWTLVQFTVQENDFHSGIGQFLNQEHLIGILAC
jgi:hypothetical protein